MTEDIQPQEPVVLVEWFDDHWYKVSKDSQTHWLPSVTTKLGVVDKPGISRWRGDLGNREADLRMYEAGQRGKRLHWAREMLLTGGAVIYDPWQTPVYTDQGLIDLKEKYQGKVAILRTQDEMVQIVKLHRQLQILKPKILGVEVRVYDLQFRDAGTIDGIYEIAEGDYMVAGSRPLHLEGGIYVEDFKSGNFMDEKVWMQLAPYTKMWEDMTRKRVQGALVTHTGARTKAGVAGLTTLFRDRETLLKKDYIDYRHAAALWERDHEGDQPEQFQFPSILTYNGGPK
jgi:hypothetical protein